MNRLYVDKNSNWNNIQEVNYIDNYNPDKVLYPASYLHYCSSRSSVMSERSKHSTARRRPDLKSWM